jgi:DNA-binding LacI/PurR family transcriptional regulator
MRAIHAHQMRIPKDIALVGFDDIQWAVPEQVSVTTVIQSAYELGSAAANRLIQRLQKPDAPRQEIVLQHQLAVGTTSAPRAARETFPRSISARVEKNKKKAPRRVISQETFSD